MKSVQMFKVEGMGDFIFGLEISLKGRSRAHTSAQLALPQEFHWLLQYSKRCFLIISPLTDWALDIFL
jgi:hypothetical protein